MLNGTSFGHIVVGKLKIIVFARRAYCIVLQILHVRLCVCLSSVCALATKASVTFLCYFELFLDPRNSVYRL